MASNIKLKNNLGNTFTLEHTNDIGDVSLTSTQLKNIRQVDTIADLRAMTDTQNTIWVSGYHTKDDGAFGSNIFRWNPTSTEDDNGGTIIKLDSVATGRYELQYDGAVNVKWFGAKGDGITDDTVAIQRADATGKLLNMTFSNDFNINTFTAQSEWLVRDSYNNVGSFSGEPLIYIKRDSIDDIFGVIRQDSIGSGWYFINDSLHKSKGFAVDVINTTETDTTLTIPYLKTYSKVGSLTVVTDETFAGSGITVGASVGVSSASLRFYAPLTFKLNLGTLQFNSLPSFFPATVTHNVGSGYFTINFSTTGISKISDVVIETPNGDYSVEIGSSPAYSLVFRIRDGSGAVVTSPTFTVMIDRGLTQIAPYNLSSTLGNFWISGKMFN